MAPPTWNAGHLTAGEIQATSMAPPDGGHGRCGRQNGELLKMENGWQLWREMSGNRMWRISTLTLYSFELRVRDVHGNLSWKVPTTCRPVMTALVWGIGGLSITPFRHPFVAEASDDGAMAEIVDRRWRGIRF